MKAESIVPQQGGRGDKPTAITLMRMALPLLDNAGESTAACHLQHALDTAEGIGVLKAGEEVSAEVVAAFLDT